MNDSLLLDTGKQLYWAATVLRLLYYNFNGYMPWDPNMLSQYMQFAPAALLMANDVAMDLLNMDSILPLEVYNFMRNLLLGQEFLLQTQQIVLWPIYKYVIGVETILLNYPNGGIPFINDIAEVKAFQIPDSLSTSGWAIFLTLAWWFRLFGILLQEFADPFLQFSSLNLWTIRAWHMVFGILDVNWQYGWGIILLQFPWTWIVRFLYPW